MLSVDIKNKQYGNGCRIIADLKIDIQAGERIAIVAPSGAGKSTFLRILSGVDKDFIGCLSVRPNAEHGGENRDASWPAAAVMFQDSRLLPWLTVEQNLTLVVPQLSAAEAKERARALLHDVGLEDMGSRYPSALSGGMQRRVALARALMPRLGLLLLDEPLISLDIPSVERLRKVILKRCTEDGLTLIYVTHDLDEAVRVANRILFLSDSPVQLLHEEILAENISRNQSLIRKKCEDLRGMRGVMEGQVSHLQRA